MKIRLFLLSAVLLLSGFGPFLLLPGGKLDGTRVSVPDNWTFTASIKTIQLETNPADPYSVNIWAIGMGSVLYVHAGANRTTWVENMERDPGVIVRIEDKLYPLRASRVTDGAEFARFSDAYEQKYERRPRNENVAEAYLFRLEGAP